MWGGRRILTIPHAAARYGITINAMTKALTRLGLPPIDPPPIDKRTPLYYATELDAAMRTRPGKGANLRGRR